MIKISINSSKANELIDITNKVQKAIEPLNIEEGLLTLFCPHTTAGITVNEAFDSSVKSDIIYSLNKISPNYTEFTHGEGNSDAHVKASLIGCCLNLIINKGEIVLGQWQGIYFTEFDGPRCRELFLQVTS